MKYWEIIADNLKKRGWSLGWVSAIYCEGRTIWISDAHRGDGKRFVVRADEKLTAFAELESAIHGGRLPVPRQLRAEECHDQSVKFHMEGGAIKARRVLADPRHRSR